MALMPSQQSSRLAASSRTVDLVAPAGFEPLLGGSGESRPLPIRVILQGFFVAWLPTDPVHSRPFPTAPLENVRKRWPSGAIPLAGVRCDAKAARPRLASNTVGAPDVLVRILALLDPSVRGVVADLGERTEYSNAKARTQLGWHPRPFNEIVVCAGSLLANGVVGA